MDNAVSNILNKLGLVPFFVQQLADAALLEERLGRVTSVQRSKTTVVCESGEHVVGLSPALLQSTAVDRPTAG